MARRVFAISIVLALCVPHRGTACSQPLEEIQATFDRATAVFAFRVVSSTTIKNGDRSVDPEFYGGERVRAIVTKWWKGSRFPGSIVLFETPPASGGNCLMNTTNNPTWLGETGDGGVSSAAHAAKLRADLKEWLFFAEGAEPWQLRSNQYTAPLAWSKESIEMLNEMRRKQFRSHEPAQKSN